MRQKNNEKKVQNLLKFMWTEAILNYQNMSGNRRALVGRKRKGRKRKLTVLFLFQFLPAVSDNRNWDNIVDLFF